MPAGGALFGSSASRSQSKNLVEFKAGKMTMKGKMVHPDKRKGLVYVYQSEDSLMHFCWKDRGSGTVEDDLIIFPDDCEFKKVAQCTTGRVYVLKFKSSNRKFFFWIQEPKTEKDEDNARKINEVLNNPPTPGRSGGVTPDENLQNLLQNMSQQQLMQLFGGVGQIGGLSSLLGTISRPSTSQSSSSRAAAPASGGTTAASATTTPKSSTAPAQPSTPRPKPPSSAESGSTQNPIQLSDLQNFLSGLGVAGAPGSSAPPTDLSSAITSETLQAVVNNPAVVEELSQHLPSTPGVASQQEHLRSTLASPQFQQAVSLFSTALQSGQLGPIVSQFEVGPEAVSAANQGNMEDFVKALQNTSLNSSSSSEPSQPEKRKKTDDKKDDDDEDMALD
ncbi:proteasomal ubiquitin receptor ADRM1-A isoform X2 [Macrosteles quadrilineatus]|uniref:proteasomal ubiquitin receptor ADRM1-A-like isoform X2 n=1 Tax=Macrosteles quadrilineatus TaxID=74068 RepID=UPI0023E1A427|nr:proteasomal ubiquitin receptor ADRM1-A-like isoform X2 [Macrosteles quadrilineatus]XP_054269406.1 proteasomal ubiquitin receptor ADRM1-A isoform X2 [Macrosteles quadrilineatus]